MATHSANSPVLKLYESFLNAWNNQRARDMGDLLTDNGSMVGFDGSQLNGPAEVVDTIGFIFSQHPTARFVSVVREIRTISPDVVILRATVGMIPRGGKEINPSVNAIQSLVAQKVGEEWKIALFQNTPAAFHGRPADQDALSAELSEVVAAGKLLTLKL